MRREKAETLGQQAWIAIFFFLVMALPSTRSAAQFHGFYTDKPSYEPGETVFIHASAPSPSPVIFRLIRHGRDWTEIARTAQVTLVPQQTRIGSFLEVDPTVDLLGNRTAFTIEGHFYPTMVGGDRVVLAGQAGATQASGALLLLENGRVAGYVSDNVSVDASKIVSSSSVLALDRWHHLALTYDSAQQAVILYVDGEEVGRRTQSGAVTANSQPFRIGARAEAPGDLTGIADGRFDSWAVWPKALSLSEVRARRDAATSQADPTPTSNVDLYVSFEDPYGSVLDHGSHHYELRVVNHGTPGVTGVHSDGVAMRFHHDQIVDAGWAATTSIQIPADAASGLYSIQGLIGPDFMDRRIQELTRAFAVRPSELNSNTRIAVVLPTNTWTAYSEWPGDYEHQGPVPGITSRRRSPSLPEIRHGGNNSVYGVMGDGVSANWFTGWRRPNPLSSVNAGGPGGTGHKGPQSLFLVQWLEQIGVKYDVYSDLDLDNGEFPTENHYRVLMPHGHHEYWSRKQVEAVKTFQHHGGSLVSVAGNVLTWRATHGPGGIMEIRKWPGYRPLGRADSQNAMDRERAGSWTAISTCEGDFFKNLITGSVNHLVGGCNADCYGRWEVINSDHWLWGGTVANGDRLGQSPVPGYFSVGHEADTYLAGVIPAGLAPSTTPTVLAEGVQFGNLTTMNIEFQYPGAPLPPPPTCAQIEAAAGTRIGTRPMATADTHAGSIVFFQHEGGGYVLSVGSVSAPWALTSDEKYGGLVERGLKCLSLNEGCPEGFGQPTKPDEGSSTARKSSGGCAIHPQFPPTGLWLALFIAWVLIARSKRSSMLRPPSRSDDWD